MKFLVDAQLPRRLAHWLASQGYDAVHTLDLPKANATPDSEVIAEADREKRIVVTKDADFVQTYFVSDTPHKLWLVSTGNINNSELIGLIEKNFASICRAFEASRFIEITRDTLIVHE